MKESYIVLCWQSSKNLEVFSSSVCMFIYFLRIFAPGSVVGIVSLQIWVLYIRGIRALFDENRKSLMSLGFSFNLLFGWIRNYLEWFWAHRHQESSLLLQCHHATALTITQGGWRESLSLDILIATSRRCCLCFRISWNNTKCPYENFGHERPYGCYALDLSRGTRRRVLFHHPLP